MEKKKQASLETRGVHSTTIARYESERRGSAKGAASNNEKSVQRRTPGGEYSEARWAQARK